MRSAVPRVLQWGHVETHVETVVDDNTVSVAAGTLQWGHVETHVKTITLDEEGGGGASLQWGHVEIHVETPTTR